MKTISIRELHNRTGELVRLADVHGEIRITDRGRIVAKIVPEAPKPAVPYFSRRKVAAAFAKLDRSGRTGRCADSTAMISADRDDEK